jgi:sarcosine oxidase
MRNHGVYDVIVVGVGGMGSATVYHLVSRGLRVLGLERFTIPNEMGSSHGLTRIIRLAFREGLEYVPLARRAYRLWEELQERMGEQILHITGSIHAGTTGTPDFESTVQACIAQDVPHEVLSGDDISVRFPGYRLPPDVTAVLQPDGGFLVPERCIEGYVASSRELGAEVHEGEALLDWEPTASGVQVRTDGGVYSAGALVFTSGAWTGKLLPELASLAVPERQVLAWFNPLKPAFFSPSNFPVFTVAIDGGSFYGFPAYGGLGFKVGKFHHLGEQANPDGLNRIPTPRDESVLRDFTEKYFPDAAGETENMVVCMFTNSPDEHFIIGKHATYPQVSFAAGFSGHGFKFCSVVGEIMADVSVKGDTDQDIRLFSPDRF